MHPCLASRDVLWTVCSPMVLVVHEQWYQIFYGCSRVHRNPCRSLECLWQIWTVCVFEILTKSV